MQLAWSSIQQWVAYIIAITSRYNVHNYAILARQRISQRLYASSGLVGWVLLQSIESKQVSKYIIVTTDKV